MQRAQISMSVFQPGPKVVKVVAVETEVQASASRMELWAVVVAARVFHRRATCGRLDANQFRRAAEDLEKALADLPAGVFA